MTSGYLGLMLTHSPIHMHPNRRLIEGQLDVHPRQNAIVVHYEVEAVVLSEYGESMVADRKECKKL